MEFETKLAATVTVRTTVKDAGTVHEIKMFGGIGFMLNGNLLAAVSRRGLLVRVGKDMQPAALEHHGARPMVMRGRTMQGYIYVNPPHLSSPTIRKLLRLAIRFVQSLPPKASRAQSKSPKKTPKQVGRRQVKPRAKR